MAARSADSPWRSGSIRGSVLRFLAFAVALGGLRLCLPWAVLTWVRHVFGGLPGYSIEIDDLDLNLWRGAYELERVRLFQKDAPALEPLFAASQVDLSLDWSGLRRGVLIAEIAFDRPVMSFAIGSDAEDSQTGEGVSWAERLGELFPFRIDRVVARDGELRFAMADVDVDLMIGELFLEAENLTNIRDASKPLPARIELAGRPLETGELEAVLQLDALADPPRFELDLEVRRLPLIALNDVLTRYGKVDAEGGEASFYVELAAADGRLEGYLKTLLEDVELASFGEVDDPVEALEALWEAFVELAAEVLENQPHDRLATRIPLEGTLGGVETSAVDIVLGVLRNAFVEALRPVLDESVDIGDVAQGVGGKP